MSYLQLAGDPQVDSGLSKETRQKGGKEKGREPDRNCTTRRFSSVESASETWESEAGMICKDQKLDGSESDQIHNKECGHCTRHVKG